MEKLHYTDAKAANNINLSLASLVDQTLDKFPWRLTFPEHLEAFYNEDSRKERSYHLYIAGFLALLVYDLFLISDFFMIHDVFKTALYIRLLAISPVMIVGMIIQYRNPHPYVREAVESTAIFLPGVDSGEAALVAERIRLHIFSLELPHRKGVVSGRITLSGGVSGGWIKTIPDTTLLIQEADEALYTAKRSGKNQVIVRAVSPLGERNE